MNPRNADYDKTTSTFPNCFQLFMSTKIRCVEKCVIQYPMHHLSRDPSKDFIVFARLFKSQAFCTFVNYCRHYI